jgi:soluble lytic murein transglycosylase-like protein
MTVRFLSITVFAVVLQPLFGRESVCLTNGFCLEADSHVVRDQTFIVQRGQGSMEFPAGQVEHIAPLPSLANPQPVAALPPENTQDLLGRAAREQGLEPEFVRSVARAESDFRQDAVSVKGAVGLMQLMPGTASSLGVDASLAEQNAQGGAKFLRELLVRYHGDATLALAAYNAGPGAVEKYKGVPPYLETRRYIVRVLTEYARQQKVRGVSSLDTR